MASKSAAFAEFKTREGAKIFRIPLEAFPGFWAYVYLVHVDPYLVLIDSGSGFGDANQQILAGLEAASSRLEKLFQLSDLTHIFITHGHIDHFGGLAFLREKSQAEIVVHQLDLRNIAAYEERIARVSNRLHTFFIEAGLSRERSAELLNLYTVNKGLFHSVPVSSTVRDGSMAIGPFEFFHVPGHSAGHVLIRLHDVFFVGDHILNRTSPHMAPESLTLNTGLGHYLQSLDKAEAWCLGASLILPGHEDPIADLGERVAAIKAHHVQRLEKVLSFADAPRTVREISHHLFRQPNGYNAILAVEEAAAHVEYLYLHGRLRIENISELENSNTPVPHRYVAVPENNHP